MAVRLPAYEERRRLILARLKAEVEEIDAKVAFIKAVIDGHLELSRKTDAQILEGLIRCKIPALSGQKTRDDIDSYEYVLKMRIDRVKESAVRELMEQAHKKREAMAEMERKTASSLWMEDIDTFTTAWGKYGAEREVAYTAGETATATTGKKRATRATKAKK
jgi:hypothetical protein